MARAPDERIQNAQELYKQGMKLVDIASQLNVPVGTVRSWKNRGSWECNATQEKKCNVAKDVSWIEIEKEYITDIRKKPCSLKDLSEKYYIDYDYLRRYAATNSWKDKRDNYITKTTQKAIEKASEKDSDRIAKLLRIADIATQKAEQSLGELENYIVRNKKKVKVIEYKDPSAIGRPTKETISEDESIEVMDGPIDRLGLMQVTNALKNIKELYNIDIDTKKSEYELSILKTKANGEDGEEMEDDGFLEALKGKVSEIWEE